MIRIDRRQLVKSAGFGLGALLLPGGAGAVAQLLGARGFTHGVASGEPAADSLLIWTRFVGSGDDARLRGEVSETADFARIAGGGELITGPWRDWTAKLTVTGLKPGRPYYYHLVAPDGSMSPVGRAKTLPEGRTAQWRAAVFSCANMGFGWFNAYAHAAARSDLDALVHLGDYFYEYAPGIYPSMAETVVGRLPEPQRECVHLADYRLRYASYRADPDLQALHAAHAMIAQWDDHETGNDSWEGGAENHQPDEGDWSTRKAAAMQAWREWMPVSDAPWKSYAIGDLATLHRTDMRLEGRSRPPELAGLFKAPDPAAALKAFRDDAWMDPAMSMMGSQQEAWLARALARSVKDGRRWQVLCSGTIMGEMRMPEAAMGWLAPDAPERARAYVRAGMAAAKAGLPLNLDSWGGYPAARSRLLKSAQAADANLIVIAGDSHNAWAHDLAEDGRPVGVEFDGQSVTSAGYESAARAEPAIVANGMVAANPGLRWAETSRRGYFTLTLTPAAATSEWTFLDTVRKRSTAVAGTHRMRVHHGRKVLEDV